MVMVTMGEQLEEAAIVLTLIERINYLSMYMKVYFIIYRWKQLDVTLVDLKLFVDIYIFLLVRIFQTYLLIIAMIILTGYFIYLQEMAFMGTLGGIDCNFE